MTGSPQSPIPSYTNSQVGTCPRCGFSRHINKYGIFVTCGHDQITATTEDRSKAIQAIERARSGGQTGVWLTIEQAESLIK